MNGDIIRNPPFSDTVVAYWVAHTLEKTMEANGINWRKDYLPYDRRFRRNPDC